MDKNEALAKARGIEREIHSLTYDLKKAVVAANQAGASWAEIGHELGISKQTAYNRYKEDVASEERTRKWREENPEKYAAAVARGVAQAEAAVAEIRAGRPRTKKIECTHCSWTVAYPPNEEDEAYMDFEDHMNTTHEDDAYREDAINEENAAKILDGEVPASELTEDEKLAGARAMATKILNAEREAKAAKKAAKAAQDWDQGDPKHFATPIEGRPDKCAYCGSKHHKHGKNTWIYRGCTPTSTDPVFTLITGITVGTTTKDTK